MKVRDLIIQLLDTNMNAEVKLSTGNTFNDVADIELTFGGPNCGDGCSLRDVPFVYINNLDKMYPENMK